MTCSFQLVGIIQSSWISNGVIIFGVCCLQPLWRSDIQKERVDASFQTYLSDSLHRSGTFELDSQNWKYFTLYCLSCLWKSLVAKVSLRSSLYFGQWEKGKYSNWKENCKIGVRQRASCSAVQYSFAGLLFGLATLVRRSWKNNLGMYFSGILILGTVGVILVTTYKIISKCSEE